MGKKQKQPRALQRVSISVTRWMGTPWSILLHSGIFASTFVLILFGIDSNRVMLILTTAVSLEAIYLSLFIQMTVNRNTESLEEVEEDVEDISEDVEDISEDTSPVEDSLKVIEQQLTQLAESIHELKKHQVIEDTSQK